MAKHNGGTIDVNYGITPYGNSRCGIVRSLKGKCFDRCNENNMKYTTKGYCHDTGAVIGETGETMVSPGF